MLYGLLDIYDLRMETGSSAAQTQGRAGEERKVRGSGNAPPVLRRKRMFTCVYCPAMTLRG